MAFVYLGLGSNLGNKTENLRNAIIQVDALTGKITCQSAFYSSEPWGFESDNNFLNAVILLETTLLPLELLERTQQIEQYLGRKSKSTDEYADRPIDIDILLYDDLIVDLPELKIPHPLIKERDFVLIPLAEIAPELTDPLSGRKYADFIR